MILFRKITLEVKYTVKNTVKSIPNNFTGLAKISQFFGGICSLVGQREMLRLGNSGLAIASINIAAGSGKR